MVQPARSAPKVVFIARESPLNQSAGHTVFLRGFLDACVARGADVTVLISSRRVGQVVTRHAEVPFELRASGVVRVGPWSVVWSPAVLAQAATWAAFRRSPPAMQRLASRLRDVWRERRGVDHVLGDYPGERRGAWLQRQLTTIGPDALFYYTFFTHPGVDDLPAVKASYVITVDVLSERSASLKARGYRVVPDDLTVDVEIEALRKCGDLIAIQWDDAARFRELLPETPVMVVPVTFPVTVRQGEPVAGRCVFVGSAALHNADGLKWFLEHCWPEIHRRVPGSSLAIYGSVTARIESPGEGVLMFGEVPSLDEAYEQAAVVVVPLRAGSGLKVKLVDAICRGVATVTTSVGAQGLLAVEPRPFALADEPAEIVDAVVKLLTDGAERRVLEDHARAAARLFDPTTAYDELADDMRAKGVSLT